MDSKQEKLFLINRREIAGRHDPEYYRPRHYEDLEKLEKSPYKLTVLDKVCSRIVDGPFGSAIKASDYVDKGIPFIRVADVTRGEGTIKTKNMIFISEKAHKRISRSKVEPGDVIIAKTGATMGAASVIPDSLVESNIRGDLGALTTNVNVLPNYVIAFINTGIGQRLFWRLNSGGTRGRVVIGNLKRYPILVPSLTIQKKVIERMNDAYKEKKEKKRDAKKIFDKIDAYFLDELGVVRPEIENKTIYERSFVKKFSKIGGGRIDPNYHIKFDFILNQKSKYELVRLRELVVGSSQYGANEKAKEAIRPNDVRYIRITDIDELGMLKHKSFKTAQTVDDKYKLNKNDLLFARSGSVGRAYIHKDLTQEAIFAGYLIRFVLNTELADPDYILYFCHTSIYKLWVDAIHRPAVQSNINSEEYMSLPIFLPSLKKQQEIAVKIKAMRQEAFKILLQAEAVLESAKQDVEAMLLGGV